MAASSWGFDCMSKPDSQEERRKRRFGALEQRIGYKFQSHSNLEKALTHPSVQKKNEDNFHYQRLEFLGDRVLGLSIANILHFKFPEASEGELALRYNALVRGRTLAEIADEISLYEFIRTGGDLKKVTGKRMQSIRADVMEALIAAIYLDGGLNAVQRFVDRLWAARIEDSNSARRDSKTELQEWAHARNLGTPKYRETERTGPAHDPEFTVTVKLPEKIGCSGTGRSKRIAEQNAAAKMLVREGVWKEETPEGK